MSNLKAFFVSSTLQMKQTFSRNMFRFMMLVQPLVFGTILYLMFKGSSNDDLVSHVIFGTGLITIWGTIVFSSASDIDRERRIGTLGYISCAPVKFIVIMSGKIFGNVILGFFSMVYSTLFIVLVYKVKFHIEHPLHFVLTMFLTIISFIAISLMFAALLTLSRQARVFMNALDYPIYIICGLVFPIDMLPIYLRYISYILSPTWANELLKATARGINDFNDFYFRFGILAFITVTYFILSFVFFRLIDKKARIDATLEVI